MTDSLRPYPEYKDSGVDWLGEIPAHWEVYPHRSLFTEIIERDCPDEQMLSVTIARGVLPQSQLLASSSKKDSSNTDKSNYKLVSEGDITYNKMRAWQGAIGASAYRGIISPAYIVVRLRNEVNKPWYFHYLFRTPRFTTEAERWSYGITSDQWSLRYGEFKQIYSPLPPPDEQAAIVTFLDAAEGRIRRYIRAKQKLIKLLNEQIKVLVLRATTRGLNDDAPVKDSGLEWLSHIPSHWEIRRNGTLFIQRNETGFPELPILEVSLRTGVRVRDFDNSKRKQVMSDRSKYKRAHEGDIAYNMMRMWQGAVGVAPVDGLISPAYVIARPLEGTNSRYYEYLFRTGVYMNEVNKYSRGIVSDRNRLYWQDFKQMWSPFPPPEEQEEIVDFLDSMIDKNTRQATTKLEDQISLIREYKARLIADVITGKVDVRGLAFEIPEAFGEDDLLDVDDDEMFEEDELDLG